MTFNSFEDKKVSEKNALTEFIAGLSDEEKAMPINQLSTQRIAQYIQAIFEFQVSVMPDLEQNATRSMMVLLNEMSHVHVPSMELDINFEGTKDEVKEEKFRIFIEQIKEEDKDENLLPEKEHLTNLLREQHNKISLFVHNEQKIVELFHLLCERIPTPNNSNIALLTAGILVVFEYLSFKNIARICFLIEAQATPIKTAMHHALNQHLSAPKAQDLDFDEPTPVHATVSNHRFYRAIFDRDEIEYVLSCRPESQYKN